MKINLVAAIILACMVTCQSATTKPAVTKNETTTPDGSSENILDQFYEAADRGRDLANNFGHSTAKPLNNTTAISTIKTTLSSTKELISTTFRPVSSIPKNKSILKVCRKLPTRRLRGACRRITENSFVATMEQVHAFVDESDEKKFRGSAAGARILSIGPTLPGEHDCETTCPTRDAWMKGTTANERSFSPWRMCNHYDPNRLPQWVYHAKCQCSGCMNPLKEKVDNSFSSVEIKTILPVIRKKDSVSRFKDCDDAKCQEETMELSLGCHCVVPFDLAG